MLSWEDITRISLSPRQLPPKNASEYEDSSISVKLGHYVFRHIVKYICVCVCVVYKDYIDNCVCVCVCVCVSSIKINAMSRYLAEPSQSPFYLLFGDIR